MPEQYSDLIALCHRGYKLGKQKFSYNAITLILQDNCGPKIIASAVEAPIGVEVAAELKQR